MRIFWWIFAIFGFGVLGKTVDPEFDEDRSNWILASKTILMMKNLPPGANYTRRQYYRNWNLVWEEELARKDLAYVSAPYIDLQMTNFTSPEPVITLLFLINILDCEDEYPKNISMIGMRDFHYNGTDYAEWIVDYCGSPTVLEWCGMGRQLKTKMRARPRNAYPGLRYRTIITATCPLTFLDRIAQIFYVIRPENEDESHYTVYFWIVFGTGIAVVVSLFAWAFLIINKRYSADRNANFYRYQYQVPAPVQKRSDTPKISAIVEMEMAEIPKRK